MILISLLIRYHNYCKLELVCNNFDKNFAHKLYLKGWKYLDGHSTFYQTFYHDERGLERITKFLKELQEKKIKVKVVDLTK